ncbi:8079_t:CDS:10, partial [Racocetra fulgida]
MSWNTPQGALPYGQPRPSFQPSQTRPGFQAATTYATRPVASQPFAPGQAPPYAATTARVWTEHTAPDGRTYYYNTVTKQSSWDKPEELKTPEEFTADGGRKYFYNSITKESKWEMPAEYKANGNIVSPNQQDFERARQLSTPAVSPVNTTPINVSARPLGLAGSHIPIVPIQQSEPVKIEFDTKEEAEAAFREMLKKSDCVLTFSTQGVKSDWSWEQTMRATISNPMYRALKTLNERKQAFERYVDDLIKKEEEIQRAVRKENKEKFSKLLRSLSNITEATRWVEAQTIYMNTPEYLQDKSLQEMDMLDFLAVYEEHIRNLERETSERKKREGELQARQQRKNRDAYRAFMEELRQKNVVTAKSKWKEIYPLINTDERYQNILGQQGSNPLELFWDVVEELDEILYSHRKIVNEIMKSKDISMSSGFTFEEFQEILSSDERISSVNERQRRKLDAFKSILKHFESMIAPEATWEQVRPILEKTEEFQAVGSEEQRVEIFTKFMERVKHLEKSGEDSEEEEGTIKDEDLEEDRHASSDRKKKHKSHRSYHHRRPHHSDYSADSADLSDKEKDGSDKRKRRKYESRYTEPKYQEYNKFTDPKHGEHKSLSPKSEIIKQTSPKPEESIKFQSPIRDFPQREVSKHADSSAEEGEY